MKRDTAIKALVDLISIEALKKTTCMAAEQQPYNYPLQLLNAVLHKKEEETSNWFTALGVLSIHQGLYALQLIHEARKLAGQKPLSIVTKRHLLTVIAQGAKLTKADAG